MAIGEHQEAVRKMQDFIDQHLIESISLLQLARASGYSPYHAARLFKEVTGTAPFDYIRQLRLSESAIILSREPARVLDVALDFVFDSHEGFTRAFSRQFGMTPQQYRQNRPPLRLFMPDRIISRRLTRAKGARIMTKQENIVEQDLQSIKGPEGEGLSTEADMSEKDSSLASNKGTVFVQVIDRPARKLILKRGIVAEDYFAYCEEVGCDIWGILTNIEDALYEPAGFWLPASMRLPNTSEYVQGVEVAVDYQGSVPEGFELFDLPPCQMMVFQGPPFKDEDFEEAIGSLWEIMDRYDPKPYGFVWADDDGPRFQLEPQGYRGYIEGRPVRKQP